MFYIFELYICYVHFTNFDVYETFGTTGSTLLCGEWSRFYGLSFILNKDSNNDTTLSKRKDPQIFIEVYNFSFKINKSFIRLLVHYVHCTLSNFKYRSVAYHFLIFPKCMNVVFCDLFFCYKSKIKTILRTFF